MVSGTLLAVLNGCNSVTAPVRPVELLPSFVQLGLRDSVQFVVVSRNSDGKPDSQPVALSTSQGGTISPSGLYHAGASAGSYLVTATRLDGASDTSAVMITAPIETSFYDGFESGLGAWFLTTCCLTSAAADSQTRRSGRYSARAELHVTDPLVGQSKRAELRLTDGNVVGGVGNERWYGLSIYVPPSWRVDVNPQDYQILAQWHNLPDIELDEGYTPPPLAIWIDKGEWAVWSFWDPNLVTQLVGGVPINGGGGAELWHGAFQPGSWTDWVVHARWSYLADGLLEVWRDGVKVVTRSGPNTYNDRRPMYLMVGLYKWPWETPGVAWSESTRVAYFDEVRVAGASGTYAQVAPQ